MKTLVKLQDTQRKLEFIRYKKTERRCLVNLVRNQLRRLYVKKNFEIRERHGNNKFYERN